MSALDSAQGAGIRLPARRLGCHRRSWPEVQERDDGGRAMTRAWHRARRVGHGQRSGQSRDLSAGALIHRDSGAGRTFLHGVPEAASIGLNHGDRRAHRHPEQPRRVRLGSQRRRVRWHEIADAASGRQCRQVERRERGGSQPAGQHRVAHAHDHQRVALGQPADDRLPRRLRL
jgi:hypothetical protein